MLCSCLFSRAHVSMWKWKQGSCAAFHISRHSDLFCLLHQRHSVLGIACHESTAPIEGLATLSEIPFQTTLTSVRTLS